VGRYVIRGGREGYERLQLLARVHGANTSHLLGLAGVRPGMHCVDIGCGGGEVTFEIARLVGAGGRVTGMDLDEIKLSLARAAASSRGLTNVDFRAADVDDWHEPDAYDLVYSRFLLQHVTRPLDLVRRMWSAVRVGGVIAVEDADFGGLFCHPPNDGYALWADTYCQVLALRGGDPTVGRKLFGYFLEAGIPRPSMRLLQRAEFDGEAKTLPLSTLEATAEAVVAEGIASADQVDAALTSLREFTKDPGTVVGDPRVFQVWAKRDHQQRAV
jgi:ubiquinone/menaquinone biosynthesis C-methylase UbiE